MGHVVPVLHSLNAAVFWLLQCLKVQTNPDPPDEMHVLNAPSCAHCTTHKNMSYTVAAMCMQGYSLRVAAPSAQINDRGCTAVSATHGSNQSVKQARQTGWATACFRVNRRMQSRPKEMPN